MNRLGFHPGIEDLGSLEEETLAEEEEARRHSAGCCQEMGDGRVLLDAKEEATERTWAHLQLSWSMAVEKQCCFDADF